MDGGDGDDVLWGWADEGDQLFGGDGDDFLGGGEGDDLCDGGRGKDRTNGICAILRQVP
jgi:Ca2+-binding RTX toxin-like protein